MIRHRVSHPGVGLVMERAVLKSRGCDRALLEGSSHCWSLICHWQDLAVQTRGTNMRVLSLALLPGGWNPSWCRNMLAACSAAEAASSLACVTGRWGGKEKVPRRALSLQQRAVVSQHGPVSFQVDNVNMILWKLAVADQLRSQGFTKSEQPPQKPSKRGEHLALGESQSRTESPGGEGAVC